MLDFSTYIKADYQVNWHHQSVCGLLDDFIKKSIKKLMIWMPPQTGKSTLSSRHCPAFVLGVLPNTKIALCSYAAELAQSFNRDVQRIIDNDPYKELFPKTTLSAKNIATDSKGVYKRTADIFEIVGYHGFMRTTGVGGPLTGTSVDIGIVDDPFKDRKEANSPTIRESVWNWFTDVFETRLHNDSQQLILLTRWHQDDLAGRILERDGRIEDGGEWVVVSFPAIKEDNSNLYDPRKIGEALWPEKHSLERMEKIREKSPRTFASLYQQRPAPAEGNIVKDEYFTKVPFERLPEAVRNVIRNFVVDTAYTEKQENDPSAILAYTVHNNFLYLLDYSNVRKRFGELKRFIRLFVQAVGSDQSKIYIEPKANGLSIVQELKDETKLNVIAYNLPKGDKISRLNAVEPYLEAGRVVLVEAPWNESFIEECKVFPNGPHDEAVDLLTMSITQGLVRSGNNYDGDADYA